MPSFDNPVIFFSAGASTCWCWSLSPRCSRKSKVSYVQSLYILQLKWLNQFGHQSTKSAVLAFPDRLHANPQALSPCSVLCAPYMAFLFHYRPTHINDDVTLYPFLHAAHCTHSSLFPHHPTHIAQAAQQRAQQASTYPPLLKLPPLLA